MSDGKLAVLLVTTLLVVDQVIKLLVKTHMPLYDTIEITSWFKLHFIENVGMAYGMKFVNKLVLSLFRIVAVCALAYYIWLQVRQKARRRYVVLLSLVTAGAAGNILDSMFYGLIFSESTPLLVSSVVPFGRGYAPFLMGKVVDMFYFPLFTTTLPDWLPVWGGQPYTFFSPVFNFADACISVGVVLLLLFCRAELSAPSLQKQSSQPEEADVPNVKADGQEAES